MHGSSTRTGNYKFGKDDFFYATKFGAPANSNVKVGITAKLLILDPSTVNTSSSKSVYLEVALYQDDKWEDIRDILDTESCAGKRARASYTTKLSVSKQGDPTNLNMEIYSADRPHIYYMVVLDC